MRCLKRLLLLGAVLTFGISTFAQTKFKISVYTSDANTLQTTATIIEGPRGILLVDAGFTQTDAAKILEKIKATGKPLKIIFITSSEPEHYFGLNTLKAAFPHALVWANGQTINGMLATFTDQVKMWKPILGDKEVPDHMITPFGVPSPIQMDNEEIQVLGPYQGPVEGCGGLFIPGNKTLIAGDLIFNNVHAFTATTNADQRKAWLDALDKLKKLQPIMVVAGHKDPNSPDEIAAIDQTMQYLRVYDKALKQAHSADELIYIMDDQVPDLKGLDTALKVAAAKAFPEKN
jgi:glyoxylase-like metal-dependent hydrolase (beta-lactamase superfamily II)